MKRQGAKTPGDYFIYARTALLLGGLGVLAAQFPASAQTVAGDTFADGANGAKVHMASGFVCPAKIGTFERDAVGESDPETGADFCAYGALDGVYGTIKLVPLHGAYDAKQSLAGDFAEQEGTGGRETGEAEARLAATPGAAPLAVYTRTYETSKLEDLHYRVLFTGAAVKGWAIEATIEFAEPRDVADEQQFLRAVYAAAQSEIRAKP
jgi:hypothetical protein